MDQKPVIQIAQVEVLTKARALKGPFDYLLGEGFKQVKVGSLLRVPFGRREVIGVVVARTDKTDVPVEKLAEPIKVLEVGIPAPLVELATQLAVIYCSTVARCLALVAPPGVGLSSRPRSRLRTKPKAIDRTVEHVGARAQTAHKLNDQQREVMAEVVAQLSSQAVKKPLLLHGVTGSGKTEVYLQTVDQILKNGQGAIILVPEIGLTPQTVGRFHDRFGDQVAVIHSELTEAQRYDEWLRLRNGECRICIGPRSAVFAPIENLGLIVVDEEHDSSYKQESDPRYDARRVAELRAELEHATLIIGSATPRPESYLKTEHLRMTKRADGSPMPPVELLAMAGINDPLHSETRRLLLETKAAGGKAVVLVNRRGWSNFLTCRSCGHAWQCPNCDVTLVLHRNEQRIACHHCGHSQPLPSSCEQCGSVSLVRHGSGSERIEHELEKLFAGESFPVIRLDSDISDYRGATADVLRRFDQAQCGVLVGTQMIAKGHDFPAVTLGVVIDADQTLRFPDFRAEERTFALVAQLAGRVGRGPAGGRVVVQALETTASALKFAAEHDSDGFLKLELTRRQALRYPPYIELVRVVVAGLEAAAVANCAEMIYQALKIPDAAILGPAPLFKLRGQERRQLVIKVPSLESAVPQIGAAVDAAANSFKGGSISISVDVDPQ